MSAKRSRGPLSRSEIMARVRGKDTSPELAVRRALWRAGLRYRLHRKMPGSPDLAFVGARVAVFVDGCFWHGCPRHYSAPATRRGFWATKLRGNVERDARVDAELREMGWAVLRVWEHSIRDVDAVVARIRSAVRPDDAPADHLAEPSTPYAAPPMLGPWYVCACGNEDTVVVKVSGPGGLSPRSRRPIDEATIVCRGCHAERTAQVRHPAPPRA